MYLCPVNAIIMEQIAGIKYTKDATGRNRYVRVDLKQYGEDEALQDFLDSLEVKARKGEPTVPFEEFNRYIDDTLKKHV
jgi:hypothetical protein